MDEKNGNPSAATAEPKSKAFELTRMFNAPRTLVWKAFTDPQMLAQWWGPKGTDIEVKKLDLRPGGVFFYHMKSKDGKFSGYGKWIYREIVAPELMIHVTSFADEAGNPVRHPMSPTWPLEMLSTANFSEEGPAKTKISITAEAINATAEERATFEAGFSSMDQGFKGTMDQLDEFLAKQQQ